MEGGDINKRAEIDTRAPFRSVKEAVMLFGEKVLAGELYANKPKEMQGRAGENGHKPSKLGTITEELEETKQSLEKAKEESMVMATSLSSLQQELDWTKRELQRLKQHEEVPIKPVMETEIEDVQVVEEESRKFELPRTQMNVDSNEGIEFQKKKYVTFANHPSVAQVMIPPEGVEVLERRRSLGTKKKKPLIPLIGGIFSKKKGTTTEVAFN
ncbi:WEB family protein [Tripterygium wilfordii]|uniref:WEB family protein n=1 Tax=Tripterygium wilfordii TaxID=458696 RepID=A0A7J7D3F5_TRIWF|nr:WEB family protein At1g75720-like [Tripterygium wilfordii]KAF5740853.1 WEB family protein [Tripterygium wilfordii]